MANMPNPGQRSGNIDTDNRVKTRSPSSDNYVLIEQGSAGTLASSLDYGSELAIGSGKPASYGRGYQNESQSTPQRQILKPGFSMNSRTPSPIYKKRESEISMDDSIFNLLEQIEDQIADFQADFAKLKRGYRNPTVSIPKTEPVLNNQDSVARYITHKTRSSIALQLEAEIFELRNRLEHKTSQDHGVKRRRSVSKLNITSKIDTKSAIQPIAIDDASTRFSRFKQEKITTADLCEVFIGVVGFVHIVIGILYCLAKVSMFLIVLISPFHRLL
ncbi:hypothetical protein TWF506_000370 [Arthrobotrys conoides]|uniref:Uncharacterized protein n=1 Tax=Arthrobotrys conoides TaxID=74498 RepID=A0AAN8S474_9PEZI